MGESVLIMDDGYVESVVDCTKELGLNGVEEKFGPKLLVDSMLVTLQ